jgi:hypothetical protein
MNSPVKSCPALVDVNAVLTAGADELGGGGKENAFVSRTIDLITPGRVS